MSASDRTRQFGNWHRGVRGQSRNGQYLGHLAPAHCLDGHNLDQRALDNRALPKAAQHVPVEKNVTFPFWIGNESKALGWIEPFNLSPDQLAKRGPLLRAGGRGISEHADRNSENTFNFEKGASRERQGG